MPRLNQTFSLFTFLSLTLLISAASVADSKLTFETPPKNTPPEFAPIEDKPGLPRVLLIGDSISMGYTIPVRNRLEGKANVHRIPVNGGPTTRGVQQLDKWLGDGKWDVIHFNFGLHDVRYPNEAATNPELHQRQVSIEEYEKNLNIIAERLKKTGAKLIWRNTTPIPVGARSREPGDEVRYNEVAAKVMKAHQIPIQDLYTFVLPQTSELQRPKDVHFNSKGNAALADEVVAVIEAALAEQKK
ncbi:SGNH/GDSL hydrolase family protein [Planctomicrobium sp. SH527]|uniref:SGNH/GDSL hydrolase family protein n=1 Tax=Planctomicrobium sp. SH527 TaxID=3448123 RepID=UPI003F5B7C7C